MTDTVSANVPKTVREEDLKDEGLVKDYSWPMIQEILKQSGVPPGMISTEALPADFVQMSPDEQAKATEDLIARIERNNKNRLRKKILVKKEKNKVKQVPEHNKYDVDYSAWEKFEVHL